MTTYMLDTDTARATTLADLEVDLPLPNGWTWRVMDPAETAYPFEIVDRVGHRWAYGESARPAYRMAFSNVSTSFAVATATLARMNDKAISFGASVETAERLINMCAESCETLAGDDESAIRDYVEDLTAKLRDLGYGAREYYVAMSASFGVTVPRAANEDEASEMAREMVADASIYDMREWLLDSLIVDDVIEQ